MLREYLFLCCAQIKITCPLKIISSIFSSAYMTPNTKYKRVFRSIAKTKMEETRQPHFFAFGRKHHLVQKMRNGSKLQRMISVKHRHAPMQMQNIKALAASSIPTVKLQIISKHKKQTKSVLSWTAKQHQLQQRQRPNRRCRRPVNLRPTKSTSTLLGNDVTKSPKQCSSKFCCTN